VQDCDWRCDECGSMGTASVEPTDNAFQVAGKVIAHHNATVTGCTRREDSLVMVSTEPVIIPKEGGVTIHEFSLV
jgi:hypothetical protein